MQGLERSAKMLKLFPSLHDTNTAIGTILMGICGLAVGFITGYILPHSPLAASIFILILQLPTLFILRGGFYYSCILITSAIPVVFIEGGGEFREILYIANLLVVLALYCIALVISLILKFASSRHRLLVALVIMALLPSLLYLVSSSYKEEADKNACIFELNNYKKGIDSLGVNGGEAWDSKESTLHFMSITFPERSFPICPSGGVVTLEYLDDNGPPRCVCSLKDSHGHSTTN